MDIWRIEGTLLLLSFYIYYHYNVFVPFYGHRRQICFIELKIGPLWEIRAHCANHQQLSLLVFLSVSNFEGKDVVTMGSTKINT